MRIGHNPAVSLEVPHDLEKRRVWEVFVHQDTHGATGMQVAPIKSQRLRNPDHCHAEAIIFC